MADLVFAYDAALDRPIPVPDSAPAAVRGLLHSAPQEAFAAAVATARESRAAALVVLGSTLDPLRASPAQAAVVRRAIVDLAADGCRTIWLVDEASGCTAIARALGEPAGLTLVSPVSPLRLDIRGVAVEIACLHPDARGLAAGGRVAPSFASEHASLLPPQHRIVIGWDDSWGGTPSAHALPAPLPSLGQLAVSTSFVWGSRRPQPVPPGVHQLPALQARGPREAAAGSCGLLTLTGLSAAGAAGIPATGVAPAARADLLGGWREVATHRVAWRGLSITSLAGGDEELAAAVQTALDALVVDPRGPLQVVRVNVDCGASVSRRVRVAELVAETNARLRPPADAAAQRMWCHDLGPDPLEPMSVLARGAAAHGHGAGSETLGHSLGAFATALGAIVTAREAADASTDHREAGWLALELMGST